MLFAAKSLILDETREMVPVERKCRLEEGNVFVLRVKGVAAKRPRQDERDFKDTGKMLGVRDDSSLTF